MSMFCYQCQETAKGTGCTIVGVCGKTEEVSNLQDLLIYVTKGIAWYGTIAHTHNIAIPEADTFVFEALFMTITNANFDDNKIIDKIQQAMQVRSNVQKELENHNIELAEELPRQATIISDTMEHIVSQSILVSILNETNVDIRSLKELIVYGLKGMAAYAEHAHNLGKRCEATYAFMHKALAATIRTDITFEELLELTLETGKYGVDVMALLDNANTSTYGHPQATRVNIGVRKNPAILISGHDLRDLEELLDQTQNTGVDVYTHGEMLPAHSYPAFRKFTNFVGNYGNAWWKQREEFESFNGPVLFTTNCIIPPHESYKDRIYTTGATGVSGCTHIPDRVDDMPKDFSQIIEHALRLAPPQEIETGEIIGGFAHNQLVQLSDTIVDAVKNADIRKFVVMSGCDGRMKSRDYYTQFAQRLPQDVVILTSGCAKFRFNKLPLGDINGIPRVLDAGQCNDSYSLVIIAQKLKEILQLNDINELPIAYNIAWYEQKAVIVLLALLYLGVKNIHLGPSLPAFLSPRVVEILSENFGIASITTVDEDIKILIDEPIEVN